MFHEILVHPPSYPPPPKSGKASSRAVRGAGKEIKELDELLDIAPLRLVKRADEVTFLNGHVSFRAAAGNAIGPDLPKIAKMIASKQQKKNTGVKKGSSAAVSESGKTLSKPTVKEDVEGGEEEEDGADEEAAQEDGADADQGEDGYEDGEEIEVDGDEAAGSSTSSTTTSKAKANRKRISRKRGKSSTRKPKKTTTTTQAKKKHKKDEEKKKATTKRRKKKTSTTTTTKMPSTTSPATTVPQPLQKMFEKMSGKDESDVQALIREFLSQKGAVEGESSNAAKEETGALRERLDALIGGAEMKDVAGGTPPLQSSSSTSPKPKGGALPATTKRAMGSFKFEQNGKPPLPPRPPPPPADKKEWVLGQMEITHWISSELTTPHTPSLPCRRAGSTRRLMSLRGFPSSKQRLRARNRVRKRHRDHHAGHKVSLGREQRDSVNAILAKESYAFARWWSVVREEASDLSLTGKMERGEHHEQIPGREFERARDAMTRALELFISSRLTKPPPRNPIDSVLVTGRSFSLFSAKLGRASPSSLVVSVKTRTDDSEGRESLFRLLGVSDKNIVTCHGDKSGGNALVSFLALPRCMSVNDP